MVQLKAGMKVRQTRLGKIIPCGDIVTLVSQHPDGNWRIVEHSMYNRDAIFAFALDGVPVEKSGLTAFLERTSE